MPAVSTTNLIPKPSEQSEPAGGEAHNRSRQRPIVGGARGGPTKKIAPKTEAMTLIEVMMAVAILGMVATLIWSGFSQTARNKKRVEEEADKYQVLRVTLERMSRELASAYVSAQLNADPSLQAVRTAFVGIDRGNGDRIDFTSFSHQRLYRNAHESDQNEISYFVTRDPNDSRNKVLARREQHRIDDDPQSGGRVEVVAEHVDDFQLEYLDGLTGEWTKTWDTTQGAMQPNRLPVQVKVFLTIEDPHDPKKKTTFGMRASPAITYGLNHAIYNP